MPRTAIGDIDIYWERQGEGQPLLFISGTGGDLRNKPNEFDGPFPKAFDVLAYDQRGLGRTTKPDEPYSMAQYADDAAGLLDNVGWDKVRVIGVSFGGMSLTSPWVGPVAAAVLLDGGVYVAGAIIIVGHLRRIFQTLIGGDPFHPDNARRLRIIGIALAALEVWRYVANGLIHMVARGHVPARLMGGGGVNLTAWFAVLAVVVLAEVFREGARLRGEAELTI